MANVRVEVPEGAFHRGYELEPGAYGMLAKDWGTWKVGDVVLRTVDTLVNLRSGGYNRDLAGLLVKPLPKDFRIVIEV